jgi:copper chaperone CopZ
MSNSEPCHVEPVVKAVTAAEQSQIEALSLVVWGMGCAHCAARVRNSLLHVFGVVDADVLHTQGVAQVYYNPTLATPDQLLAAVAQAGGDGRHEYRAALLQATQP